MVNVEIHQQGFGYFLSILKKLPNETSAVEKKRQKKKWKKALVKTLW